MQAHNETKVTREVETVVIGAGITGLVTSFLLKEKGTDFLLLEKTARVGGQLHTVSDEGYLFESGPNTGVVSNLEVLDLFRKLGDDCTLVTARKESKVRLIWKRGQFHPLPCGMRQAISTPLFTWLDKFNIFLEPFRKRGNDPFESIASLTRRRLGQSYLDYAIDPFISGIYAGNPERLVTRFALPKLYRLESQYGSFIRGSIKRGPALAEEKRQGISKEIFSVKGGFEQLVNTLHHRIGDDNIRLSTGQLTVQPHNNGWLITLPNTGEQIYSKRIISTIPAYALPELLSFIPEAKLRPITTLQYVPVIQVGVGMQNGIPVPQAFGGLIPSKEKEDMLGILFNSSCYDDRAPQHSASLSFFIGGMKRPDLMQLSDEELHQLVSNGLARMLHYPQGTHADKLHIFRHQRAIPQYEADTELRLQTIDQLQTQYKGLILAGGIRDGIGLADRIKQATELARK